jgi:hypothetical protein
MLSRAPFEATGREYECMVKYTKELDHRAGQRGVLWQKSV